MTYQTIEVNQPKPVVINFIEGPEQAVAEIFSTTNEDKLREFARILDRPVTGVKLKIIEQQTDDWMDWLTVAQSKAVSAWEANGRNSVIVEDTSFEVAAWDGRPGVFINQFSGDLEARREMCDLAKRKNDHRAKIRVTLSLFDGKEIHIRVGEITGTIPTSPRGSNGFGWDDSFEPDGQEILPGWNGVRRTFAEMTDAEKDQLSMRTKAFLALKEKPFPVGRYVYMMPEPYDMQINEVDSRLLKDERTRAYAYKLRAIAGSEPNANFEIAPRQPFKEITFGPGFSRIVKNPANADIGFVITPMDTARNMSGKSKRLRLDNNDNPIFWEMGDGSVKMALAARAKEFLLFHNSEMYELVRAMMRGENKTPARTNARSEVIEFLLKMTVDGNEPIASVEDWYKRVIIRATPALTELGFERQFSEAETTRSLAAAKGLVLSSSGIPHSIFGVGGMPPVTGWRDVLVSSALSFMDCYIPRNSIYAGHPELQLQLFQEAKSAIESLSLPRDIEQLVIAHIGISYGCENLNEISKTAGMMNAAGVKLHRVYTTNPDHRVPDAAKAIRQTIGLEGRIAVGPIVDLRQAHLLIQPDITTNILLGGHGAGENCTSLAGGGAANGLELLYGMSLIPEFNDTAIGLEGGVGEDFGPLLGIIDVISKDGAIIAGAIEAGGLFAEHTNGELCQPYHGSASPPTQWIEAMSSGYVNSRRVDEAGRLRNNEGKPNYKFKHRSVNSVTDNFHFLRMLAVRGLADQQCRTIPELREKIARQPEYPFHRIVTPDAKAKALAHRGL